MAQDGGEIPDLPPLPPMPVGNTMFNSSPLRSVPNQALPQRLSGSVPSPPEVRPDTHSTTVPDEDEPPDQPRRRNIAAPGAQRARAPPPPVGAAPQVNPISAPTKETAQADARRAGSSQGMTVIQPRPESQEDNWWDKLASDLFGNLDCCAPPQRNKKQDRRQTLCGIGVALKEVGYGEMMIDHLVPGGPAQKSGLVFPGDEIVMVDDTNVYRKRREVVAGLLMGSDGSRVTVSVKRLKNGMSQTIKVDLVRTPC